MQYCHWVTPINPRLLVGVALLVVFASCSLSAVATFAVRERLPGPDHWLALISTLILAAVAITASSAPGSWHVVQQVSYPCHMCLQANIMHMKPRHGECCYSLKGVYIFFIAFR